MGPWVFWGFGIISWVSPQIWGFGFLGFRAIGIFSTRARHGRRPCGLRRWDLGFSGVLGSFLGFHPRSGVLDSWVFGLGSWDIGFLGFRARVGLFSAIPSPKSGSWPHAGGIEFENAAVWGNSTKIDLDACISGANNNMECFHSPKLITWFRLIIPLLITRPQF